MKNRFKTFQKTIIVALKLLLYVSLLAIFIRSFGQTNFALMQLSRTLGITISTFCVVGLLFLQAYGKFDIGRRKSKPIIYSLALAAICTDVITYLQLMIMNTITPSVWAFRITHLGTLVFVMIAQVVVIILFTYAGNALYFKMNDPERCCIITSTQENLNKIARVVRKFRKQYRVVKVLDYHTKDICDQLYDVETVFLYEVPIEVREKVVNYCYENRLNIYFNPEMADVVETTASWYLLDDISMINANVKELSIEQRFMKRTLDLVLAVILGIMSSPIWVVCAIAVKAYDGGPVLFKQKRATLHGKVFEVYKFRTMKENVENRSVTEHDDRITPPGRILRKIRMDELPQIWNIIKGDMSFVGPRPEMMENVTSYTEELPEFKYRLRVKAGLTGYAQISGKYNTSPKDKLMMDMMYVENYSIFKDIQLIFQTAIVLLKTDSTEAFKQDEEFQKMTFEDDKGSESCQK